MAAEKTNNFVWLIGGEAGYGILTAGEIFARTCMYAGLNVFTNTEYPSLIRGGHNTFMVRASGKEINAHSDKIDILVALNKETIDLHAKDLNAGAGIIFDPEVCGEVSATNVKLYPIPLSKLLSELEAEKIMLNTVALGASTALLELDFGFIENAIVKSFGKKATEKNMIVAQKGYSYVKNNFPEKLGISVKPLKSSPRVLVTGNDALALGSVAAGCKFAVIYTMTPTSQILHRLAAWQQKYSMIVLQPEDEISGINMAIGASHTGVRSMVATSGGGFSLMAEALGMASMTETPLVIVWGQRPGPSTGLPTKTSQGDLQFALHASQGEFPRIVLAPGDVDECFSAAQEAFNLAERWQLPVIILVDKHVCECYKSTEPFNTKIKIDRGQFGISTSGEFPRYKITETGISPRSLPGQPGGIFRAVSDEHDEYGYLTEDSTTSKVMHDKRMRKLEHVIKELPEPNLYGPPKADVTIIGWGSTKGAILDALALLKTHGITANFLHMYCIWPFPVGTLSRTLDAAKITICLEQNATGQLAALIREQTGKSAQPLLKYDGRQWTPEQIASAVEKYIKGG